MMIFGEESLIENQAQDQGSLLILPFTVLLIEHKLAKKKTRLFC